MISALVRALLSHLPDPPSAQEIARVDYAEALRQQLKAEAELENAAAQLAVYRVRTLRLARHAGVAK